jgi:hypothetical protein
VQSETAAVASAAADTVLRRLAAAAGRLSAVAPAVAAAKVAPKTAGLVVRAVGGILGVEVAATPLDERADQLAEGLPEAAVVGARKKVLLVLFLLLLEVVLLLLLIQMLFLIFWQTTA